MDVIRGLKKSWRSLRLTTDKVHAVNGDKTICGILHEKSEILGVPMPGKIEDVNCKKCLAKIGVQ